MWLFFCWFSLPCAVHITEESASKPPRLWEGSFFRSTRNWRTCKYNPVFPLMYIVIMLWNSNEQWSNLTPPVRTKSFRTSYMLYVLYNKINNPISIQIMENPNLETWLQVKQQDSKWAHVKEAELLVRLINGTHCKWGSWSLLSELYWLCTLMC